jgi:hypothetical protein
MAEYTTTADTIARVVIQKQYGLNQKTENVLHFAKTGLGGDIDDLATKVKTWVESQYAQLIANDVFFRQYTVENVLTGSQTITDAGGFAGLRTGPHAPGALAIVISLRSGTKFRYRNGRIFLDGFPIAWVNADAYGAPAPGIIAPFLTDIGPRFLQTAPTSGWNLVIYTKGNASPTAPALPWPRGAIDVKAVRFNQIFGTQRRRIPGHGT